MDSGPSSRLLLPIRSEDHAHGSEDAPYTLVEYGDYECPDCGRLYVILRDLQKDIASRLRVSSSGTILSPGFITMHSKRQKRQRRLEHKENSGKCTSCFLSGKRRFIPNI